MAAARIPIRSKEDLWTFTQRNFPLWDVLDFFPNDAIGARGPGDAPRPYEVKPITIQTDLGFSFETDNGATTSVLAQLGKVSNGKYGH